MARFQLEDTPASMAKQLLENPSVWFIIGTSKRGENQTMRTFAYRVKSGQHQGFQKEIPQQSDGHWETTIRSEKVESILYARWVPS